MDHCKWNQLVEVDAYVMFVDDYLRCVTIHFIKNKTEVLEKFKARQCGKPIMILRTDNRSIYMSKELQGYLAVKGIKYQLTVSHSHQQNSVVEQLNHTLMESVHMQKNGS